VWDAFDNWSGSISCEERRLAIAREAGELRHEAEALSYLGYAYLNLNRPDRARDCLLAALPLHRQRGDKRNEAIALANLTELLKESTA
jgi:tetratricopeptide (TPR) repeat protein